jgi:hypothetical protein
MRIKGYYNTGSALLMCPFDNFIKQQMVPKMDTVKVTNGYTGIIKWLRDVGKTSVQLHVICITLSLFLLKS